MKRSDYFKKSSFHYWEWVEQEGAFVVNGGNTIAYGNYIVSLIKKIAPQGLPPLGTLMLLVVATNHEPESSIQKIYSHLFSNEKLKNHPDVVNGIFFMRLLAHVPEEFRSGDDRFYLFQKLLILVEPKFTAEESIEFSNTLNDVSPGSLKLEIVQHNSDISVIADFKVLAAIGKQCSTVESILQTITAIPELADVNLLEKSHLLSTDPKKMVEQLTIHPKTFLIGALIQQLWSGLDIPVHSVVSSPQPMGGFSDITNKGDFSRLLISEFAHDDISFLSRLANNEALFIHREVPPIKNELERNIVIDVSIWNWGSPKILALATALAIARHPKTDIACQVFAVGDDYALLDMDSAQGVAESMQKLDSGLSPALGLETFIQDHKSSESRELIIITSEESWNQPEMTAWTSHYADQIHFLILTDEHGGIQIYEYRNKFKRQIQQMLLPIHQLWTRKLKTKPKKGGDEELEFLGHLPIRAYGRQHLIAVCQANPQKIFFITKYRSVLNSLPYENSALEFLGRNIPLGFAHFEFCWQQEIDHGTGIPQSFHLLSYNEELGECMIIDFLRQNINRFPFPQWKPTTTKAFLASSKLGKFFHLAPEGTYSINLDGIVKLEEKSNGDEKEYNELNENKPFPHRMEFDQMEKGNKALLDRYSSKKGVVLHNLRTLSLNETGYLCINSFELRQSRNHFIWGIFENTINLVYAVEISPHVYEFPNGSKAKFYREGAIEFVFALNGKHGGKTWYCPTVLNKPFGLFVRDENDTARPYSAAGESIYYKSFLNERRLATLEFYSNVVQPFIDEIVNHGS